MLERSSIGAIALAVTLAATIGGARAFDESKYPDFNGQWKRPPGIAMSVIPDLRQLGRWC